MYTHVEFRRTAPNATGVYECTLPEIWNLILTTKGPSLRMSCATVTVLKFRVAKRLFVQKCQINPNQSSKREFSVLNFVYSLWPSHHRLWCHVVFPSPSFIAGVGTTDSLINCFALTSDRQIMLKWSEFRIDTEYSHLKEIFRTSLITDFFSELVKATRPRVNRKLATQSNLATIQKINK